MARKIVEVHDRSPYGEDMDERILQDSARDSTYIAGYSDVRTQRELAIRDGNKPAPLRHRLQWARAKTSDGAHNDGRRVMHWQVDKGYKPLDYDEAIRLGYRVDENPAITKGPDGRAWLGDRLLMCADAKVAAANLRKKQMADAEQALIPQRRMERATDEFNANTKGANAIPFSFVGEDPDKKKAKK